jgi:hypothetical protein
VLSKLKTVHVEPGRLSPSPVRSRGVTFFSSPGRSTSTSPLRLILCPPFAASAAGGRDHCLAAVNSVGSVGSPAGGDEEVVGVAGVVFYAGARPLRLRRSVEPRGGTPASAALANRRIRVVLSSRARSCEAADLGCEDLEDDDRVCGDPAYHCMV